METLKNTFNINMGGCFISGCLPYHSYTMFTILYLALSALKKDQNSTSTIGLTLLFELLWLLSARKLLLSFFNSSLHWLQDVGQITLTQNGMYSRSLHFICSLVHPISHCLNFSSRLSISCLFNCIHDYIFQITVYCFLVNFDSLEGNDLLLSRVLITT